MSNYISKTMRSRERGSERRYAYALARAFPLNDSRYTVFDQYDCILGGLDEATFTFEGDDPHISCPHLFIANAFRQLLDPIIGADEEYFDRLEELAARSLDPEHARRALNIDGERQ